MKNRKFHFLVLAIGFILAYPAAAGLDPEDVIQTKEEEIRKEEEKKKRRQEELRLAREKRARDQKQRYEKIEKILDDGHSEVDPVPFYVNPNAKQHEGFTVLTDLKLYKFINAESNDTLILEIGASSSPFCRGNHCWFIDIDENGLQSTVNKMISTLTSPSLLSPPPENTLPYSYDRESAIQKVEEFRSILLKNAKNAKNATHSEDASEIRADDNPGIVFIQDSAESMPRILNKSVKRIVARHFPWGFEKTFPGFSKRVLEEFRRILAKDGSIVIFHNAFTPDWEKDTWLQNVIEIAHELDFYVESFVTQGHNGIVLEHINNHSQNNLRSVFNKN